MARWALSSTKRIGLLAAHIIHGLDHGWIMGPSQHHSIRAPIWSRWLSACTGLYWWTITDNQKKVEKKMRFEFWLLSETRKVSYSDQLASPLALISRADWASVQQLQQNAKIPSLTTVPSIPYFSRISVRCIIPMTATMPAATHLAKCC